MILFDEIEKAHPEVFNVLLQILDDGRVTDAQGRTVNFKNTVIIMTSNIGGHDLLEGASSADEGEIPEPIRDIVMQQLRSSFRPEFLNRIDDVILFKPLRLEEIKQIVGLLTQDLQRRLDDREIRLTVDEKATEFLARKGYDPAFGARPLKRFMQRELETRIGRALVAGEIPDGSNILVTVADGELKVRHVAGSEVVETNADTQA